MKNPAGFTGLSELLPIGRRTSVMGVLNVTPDSFYDGGRYFDPDAALRRAEALVEEGADTALSCGCVAEIGLQDIDALLYLCCNLGRG